MMALVGRVVLVVSLPEGVTGVESGAVVDGTEDSGDGFEGPDCPLGAGAPVDHGLDSSTTAVARATTITRRTGIRLRFLVNAEAPFRLCSRVDIGAVVLAASGVSRGGREANDSTISSPFSPRNPAKRRTYDL
jgi:hypothetical protein